MTHFYSNLQKSSCNKQTLNQLISLILSGQSREDVKNQISAMKTSSYSNKTRSVADTLRKVAALLTTFDIRFNQIYGSHYIEHSN